MSCRPGILADCIQDGTSWSPWLVTSPQGARGHWGTEALSLQLPAGPSVSGPLVWGGVCLPDVTSQLCQTQMTRANGLLCPEGQGARGWAGPALVGMQGTWWVWAPVGPGLAVEGEHPAVCLHTLWSQPSGFKCLSTKWGVGQA